MLLSHIHVQCRSIEMQPYIVCTDMMSDGKRPGIMSAISEHLQNYLIFMESFSIVPKHAYLHKKVNTLPGMQ